MMSSCARLYGFCGETSGAKTAASRISDEHCQRRHRDAVAREARAEFLERFRCGAHVIGIALSAARPASRTRGSSAV